MSRAYQRYLTASLALGFTLCIPASQGDEITTVESSTVYPTGNTVVEKRTSQVIETNIPSTTKIVTLPLSLGQAQNILQTVDLRRSELDKRIVDSRGAGSISETDASDLRRELDRIGAEVTFLKSQSSPSLIRAIALAEDLDMVSNRLKNMVPAVVLVPIIEGSHFTVFNGNVVELDDLAVRRIGLENKILAEQCAGRITFDQANQLRSALNAIAALEQAYQSSNSLTFKASRSIYTEMDKVAQQLEEYSHRR